MEDEAAKLNVVMFPWLAFGHMIPYLELAKRLAARGHGVTFLSTPRNLAPPRRSSASPPSVEWTACPIEGAESTADVPAEKNELLKKAADGLAAPFAGGAKPAWILNDFCHHWLPPRWSSSGPGRAAWGDITAPPGWCPFPPAVAYRRREAEWDVGAARHGGEPRGGVGEQCGQVMEYLGRYMDNDSFSTTPVPVLLPTEPYACPALGHVDLQ